MPKLEHPFPSSPSRPPVHVVQFLRGEKLIQSVTFAANYSALKFIEAIVGENEIRWRGADAFAIENIGVVVKSAELETIMEHGYTKAEEGWELPEPYASDAEAIATGERRKVKRSAPEPAVDSAAPSGKKEKTPKASKKPRASADGLTSIAELCESIGMLPRDARAILRKSNTPKPDAGWVWDPKDIAKIKALLSGKDKDNGGDKTPVGKATNNKVPQAAKAAGKGGGGAKRKTRR